MRRFVHRALLPVLTCTFTLAVSAQAPAKLQQRVIASTRVLHELAGVPDNGIPDNIARKAHCVLVIPSFKKGAFLGGVEYGQGLATCYVAHRGWSAPAFIRMSGISFGLQAGGEGTDLVLVGVTSVSGQKLLKEKIKLGGDIGVAAGPVGRDSKADMTVLANAGFLTYSRNKGLFAGIDLSGDEVNKNEKDIRAYYGKHLSYKAILNGAVATPPGAKGFISEVRRVFGGSSR